MKFADTQHLKDQSLTFFEKGRIEGQLNMVNNYSGSPELLRHIAYLDAFLPETDKKEEFLNGMVWAYDEAVTERVLL